MKILNRLSITIAMFVIFTGPIFVFANGTITGKYTGNLRYAPGGMYIQTDDNTYLLPTSATANGGWVIGTTYTCTYTGTLSNITGATCTVKRAVVKGNLKNDGGTLKIVDPQNAATVLATLPGSTTFPNGRVDGAYHICEYTGSLPNSINEAECDLDQTLSPTDPNSGGVPASRKPVTRLFTISGCPSGQELVCWTSKVYGWSQSALLVSAVGAFVIAGIMYMTSGGNPQVIGKSKKIMIGALSGVAIIVLGKFFLTKVIGVPWL